MAESQDIVTEARELLETHSIVAMRVDKPYKEIRPLITKLCDEVERLRAQAVEDKAAFDELMEFWKKEAGAR